MLNVVLLNHVAAKRVVAGKGFCSARTSVVVAAHVKGVWPVRVTVANAGRLAGPLANVNPWAPCTPCHVPCVVASLRTNTAATVDDAVKFTAATLAPATVTARFTGAK